jgi:hypothetical protein
VITLPYTSVLKSKDRLCGVEVRVPGYRSRGPASILCEVLGLERGPLSLVSTTEELLGRKSSGSGLENRDYGRRDPPRWPRGTFYHQKLALTSPTSGGRPVGIVRTRTTGHGVFVCLFFLSLLLLYGFVQFIVRLSLYSSTLRAGSLVCRAERIVNWITMPEIFL